MYIGEKETKWLFVILIISRIFVGAIKIFSEISGVLGTINALICSLFVFLYFWCISRIKISEDIGFFGIMKKSYGKKASIFIGAFLTLLSLFNSAERLRMFLDAVTDVILPDSPAFYVAIFFAFAILASSFLGLEAVTRYAIPTGVVIVALTLITSVFNLESYKVSNIYPLLGKGFAGFRKIPDGIILFSDIFYLYILSDFFRYKNAVKRVGLKAIAISGAIITIIVFLYSLAVPYPASVAFDYPFFRFTSLANTSAVFQRLDAAVYIIWLFSGFLCTGALCLFTMLIFTKTFNVSDYKGIVHLVVFIVIALSVSDKNHLELSPFVFSVVVFIFVPLTALIYKLRVSRSEKDET